MNLLGESLAKPKQLGNMLDMFKDNLQKEINIKIKNAQDAWAMLDQDKLTDGASNS